MCVDYRAATERILFEKYLKSLENRSGASQQLLFPQTINLNPADFSLVMEIQSDISAFGVCSRADRQIRPGHTRRSSGCSHHGC